MTEKIKLTFLGTSDAVPSASRNHPAILLTYKGENILVDCGEGTQRQFRRARLNPCRITRILITHWHADHILGIPGLLKTLGLSNYNKKLFVYGPKGTKFLMKSLLELFGVREDFPIEIKEVSGRFFEADDFYLEAKAMQHGVRCNAYSFVKKARIKIDKKKLRNLKISSGPHLKNLKKGRSIIYKGRRYSAKKLTYKEPEKKISFVLDTSFNKNIASFVKGSNALVCESSYSHELKDLARRHHHLTASQAAKIAKKAKAKKLFLIHISQRFSKNMKDILKEAKEIFKNSYLPKDLDVVEIK